jgi:flavin reductase ActVB
MLTTEPGVDFRVAMGNLAAGVVIVTTVLDGRPWGMTVSACCSISLSPPTLLVSLTGTSASARAIAESRSFGVSILGAHSAEIARFGSAPGRPKFLDDAHCTAGTDSASPVISGALAHVDCEVSESLVVADHQLFFGSVRSVVLDVGDEPLVYFGRSFRTLASSLPADLLYANW